MRRSRNRLVKRKRLSTKKEPVRLSVPRARSVEQKQERRQMILNEAWRLFQSSPYEDVIMADIADAVGLVKGTIYRCFRSKEELFLELLEQRLLVWFDEVDSWLIDFRETSYTPLQLTVLFCQSLEKRTDMLRLLVHLHMTLERNIELNALHRFRGRLLQRFTRAGTLLEQCLPFLAEGDGVLCFMRLHSLMIGLWQFCDGSSTVQLAIQDAELQIFQRTFTSELYIVLYTFFSGLERGKPPQMLKV